jgi:hypothetical protein
MKHRIWEGMLRFWEADHGLSILLALLVAIVFVLPAVMVSDSTGRIASDLAFSALLVAGAITAAESRWVRVSVASLAGAAFLVRWAAFAEASEALIIVREASTLVVVLLFAMIVAARVFRSGPVTHHRIQGAVAVFLLLGLVWANAYQLLHLMRPAAFSGAVGDAPGSQTWIYYSFVTLTTMGYGEITPVHPVARSLAISEAVSGQLYLAIMLARLVSLYMGARDRN